MISPENAGPLLEQLERLGEVLGVAIRYEILGEDGDSSPIRSGMCRLKDRKILLVDSRLSAETRCRVLVDAYKEFNLREIFVPPLIRCLIEGPDDSQ